MIPTAARRIFAVAAVACLVQGCLLSRQVLSTANTVKTTAVELQQPRWAAWHGDGVLVLCVGASTRAGRQDFRWALPLGELPAVDPAHAAKWTRADAQLVYQSPHFGIGAADLDVVDPRHSDLVRKGCGSLPQGPGWRPVKFRRSPLFGSSAKEIWSDPQRVASLHRPDEDGAAVLYLVDEHELLLSAEEPAARGRLALRLDEVQGSSRRAILALLPLAAAADVVTFPVQVPIYIYREMSNLGF